MRIVVAVATWLPGKRDPRRQVRRRCLKRGKTMPIKKLESFGSLQRFNAALAGKAAETPQLDGSRAIFHGKVGRVQGLAQQQAELTASKQDVSQQLKKELVDAQRMATALRAALKSHYGPDSEKLVEFGIPPFRGRSRKQKEPPAPPVETKSVQ